MESEILRMKIILESIISNLFYHFGSCKYIWFVPWIQGHLV